MLLQVVFCLFCLALNQRQVGKAVIPKELT